MVWLMIGPLNNFHEICILIHRRIPSMIIDHRYQWRKSGLRSVYVFVCVCVCVWGGGGGMTTSGAEISRTNKNPRILTQTHIHTYIHTYIHIHISKLYSNY